MSASSFAAVSAAVRRLLLVLIVLAIALPALAHVPRSSPLDAIDAPRELTVAPPIVDAAIELEPIQLYDAATSFSVFLSEKRAFGPYCAQGGGDALQNLMHARFYNSTMGRFLSPDPLDGLQRFPQSWNRYAYARNSPLKYIDPTGMYVFAACTGDEKQCQADQAAFEQARQENLQSKDEAVRAAAAAYGDPGQENGVTVAFGNLSQGTSGETTAGTQGNLDGTMGITASVMFQSGLRGTELRGAVGHEGQHVRDAQGFVASFAANPLMQAGLSWDITKNLTVRQTEMNAYQITHSIFRASNQAYSLACQGCNLGTAAKTSADVNRAITRILTNPGGPYAAKLNNRQLTGWDTPPEPKAKP